MAYLTKPMQYDIEDSNIALLGSNLEKRIRELAGDKEAAWSGAGLTEGIQIWRIEQFHVVNWPEDKNGEFYSGDSYIVLHTYKPDPEAERLAYDLHFWLGHDTTQDEAGTAAYKTVELDDHLHGIPVQYREIQGYESHRFLSYFPRFFTLRGGVSTGFHHVTSTPTPDFHRLYRVQTNSTTVSGTVVREVGFSSASVIQGDVYVLDRGDQVLQFNTRNSVGKERFLAAEFARQLVDTRKGVCDLKVYDEGASGASSFLAIFGLNSSAPIPERSGSTGLSRPQDRMSPRISLHRVSDELGSLEYEELEPSREFLRSSDVFLVDASGDERNPAIYIWIGATSSLNERHAAVSCAQHFLHRRRNVDEMVNVRTCIVKVAEGHESEAFNQIFS